MISPMNKIERHLVGNVSGIFFLSGISALIYQVSWQRLLFLSFGIDLTSITITVSAFMAGLGIGAFYGGRIADRNPKHILLIFCLLELFISIYGFLSRPAILYLQDVLIHSNIYVTSLGIFLFLLPPTFLMGSTLPLLTSFINSIVKNIGSSIGKLYFINTLGAVFGCIATGFILFTYLKLSEAIHIAALINLIVSIFAYFIYIGVKKGSKHA